MNFTAFLGNTAHVNFLYISTSYPKSIRPVKFGAVCESFKKMTKNNIYILRICIHIDILCSLFIFHIKTCYIFTPFAFSNSTRRGRLIEKMVQCHTEISGFQERISGASKNGYQGLQVLAVAKECVNVS